LRNIDDKDILANIEIILPVCEEKMIFILVEKEVPVSTLIKLKNKVNLFAKNDNDETCLFKISNPRYLLNFLESDIFDPILTHRRNGEYIFFDKFESCNSTITDSDYSVISGIIDISKKKGLFLEQSECSKPLLLDRAFMLNWHKSRPTIVIKVYKIVI
jgi:hypothetical protein